MNVTDSERRRNRILAAIVEVYVTTASPVGSELISRKMRQTLSSATIRHVMVDLEKEGLVEQPHTSAGRVPTDRGYRLYVNQIMEASRLSPEEFQILARMVQAGSGAIEPLFERAGEVLASLCHQAAFVVAPTVTRSTVRQIELLPLGLHRLVCVLVAQEALVVSRVIEIEEPISRDEALSLAHFLNSELAGLSAYDLLASLERRLLAVNDSFYHLVKRSLMILQTALASEPEDRFFLDGAAYLFEQPEFQRHPERTHELLRQLDLQGVLVQRLRADLVADGTRMRIGREVAIEGFEECSYVVSPVRLQKAVAGGVGILGPRRMDYRRARALTEGMAGVLTALLARHDE